MQELFLRLLKGDKDLKRQFKNSRKAWREFLKGAHRMSVQELADKFSMHQARLEWPFESNRPFAKEMLPITGLASLWSVTKDDYRNRALASKVVEVMRKSTMSWG